jgi:hypothetical protein
MATTPAQDKTYFPHMVVGEFQRPSVSFSEKLLIKYPFYPSDSWVINLWSTDPDNVDVIKTAVKAGILHSPPNAIMSRLVFGNLFPFFEEVLARANAYTGESAFNCLHIPGDDDLQLFWDSLFVHYILNTDLAMLNNLMLALKLFAMKFRTEEGVWTNEEVLNLWKHGQILFPEGYFPLPKNKPAATTVYPTTVNPNAGVMNAVKMYNDARRDILSAYELQSLNLKKAVMSEAEFLLKYSSNLKEIAGQRSAAVADDPTTAYNKYKDAVNPDELTSASIGLLMYTTRELLEDLNLLSGTTPFNVQFVLKRLNNEMERMYGSLKKTDKTDRVILVGGTLIALDYAIYGDIICNPDPVYTHCDLLKHLTKPYGKKQYVQVLGIGHANVIRQSIVRHEAGEIAHVENVLKGEKKEKTHRNLKIQDTFFSSTTERNQETATDSKTTSRFELSKETNTIANEEAQLQAGATISGGYGPVYATASVGYTSASSSSEASNTSLQTAREISERALQRIQERTLETRESRTINEEEVTNLHSINNEEGTDHINGFYYWIDKVYKNQVFNMGKRLMLEVMIPEPAAYHIFSTATSRKEGVSIPKPIHPNDYTGNGIIDPLRNFLDINLTNYHLWAAQYGVQDIKPHPADMLTVSSTYSLDYTPGDSGWHDQNHKDLKIPEGYEADFARLNIGISGGGDRYLAGYLGSKYFHCSAMMIAPLTITLNQETDMLPLSFRGHFDEYNMNVEVVCRLSRQGYDKWRMDTYNAIITAYNQQKAEYDSKVAQVENGIMISGQNPMLNREVEKTELKKWSLELLTLQRFQGFNAMQKASNGHPEMDFDEALAEGSFVKFFEQAIEWQNMTYLFYPYFWGNKPRWSTLKQLSDTDMQFTKFLQAGYARVVLPVHPKFTKAMLHYIKSGEIWNGENMPAFNDPLYLGIVEEIMASENATEGTPVGDPWETRVPTNLLMLDSTIPDNLPGS